MALSSSEEDSLRIAEQNPSYTVRPSRETLEGHFRFSHSLPDDQSPRLRVRTRTQAVEVDPWCKLLHRQRDSVDSRL